MKKQIVLLLIVCMAQMSARSNILDSIKICKWREGATTCVNFSFDDVYPKQLDVFRVFDRYGFKATYFPIGWYMKRDSIVDIINEIIASGHEIGSHTYNHLNLTALDSAGIDEQISKAKQTIEKTFGIKCLTFAEPFHRNNQLVRDIVWKYHLFSRDYSFYNKTNHLLLGINDTTKMVDFKKYLDQAISKKIVFEVCGHSIDGAGMRPIAKEFLLQILDTMQLYVNNGRVWLTTIKAGLQYENLYQELSLKKEAKGDSICISVLNYDSAKYAICDSSPISIEVPVLKNSRNYYLTTFSNIVHFENKDIVTIDLKNQSRIYFYNKPKFSLLPTDSVAYVGKQFSFTVAVSSKSSTKHIRALRFELETQSSSVILLEASSSDTSLCKITYRKLATSYLFNCLYTRPISVEELNVTLRFKSKAPLLFSPRIKSVQLNDDSIVFADIKPVGVVYNMGDVNADGIITDVDAQMIIDQSVNSRYNISRSDTLWEEWQIKTADLNNDSFVNAFDSYLVLSKEKSNEITETAIEIGIHAFVYGDTLYFYATKPLHAFNLYATDKDILGIPVYSGNNTIQASNLDPYSIAFVKLSPYVNEMFLKIPLLNSAPRALKFQVFEQSKFYELNNIKIDTNSPVAFRNISVFPNPSNSIVRFRIPEDAHNVNMYIYNEMGVVQIFKKLDTAVNIVDISSLHNGFYYIYLVSDSGSMVRKLIKI